MKNMDYSSDSESNEGESEISPKVKKVKVAN